MSWNRAQAIFPSWYLMAGPEQEHGVLAECGDSHSRAYLRRVQSGLRDGREHTSWWFDGVEERPRETEVVAMSKSQSSSNVERMRKPG